MAIKDILSNLALHKRWSWVASPSYLWCINPKVAVNYRCSWFMKVTISFHPPLWSTNIFSYGKQFHLHYVVAICNKCKYNNHTLLLYEIVHNIQTGEQLAWILLSASSSFCLIYCTVMYFLFEILFNTLVCCDIILSLYVYLSLFCHYYSLDVMFCCCQLKMPARDAVERTLTTLASTSLLWTSCPTAPLASMDSAMRYFITDSFTGFPFNLKIIEVFLMRYFLNLKIIEVFLMRYEVKINEVFSPCFFYRISI